MGQDYYDKKVMMGQTDSGDFVPLKVNADGSLVGGGGGSQPVNITSNDITDASTVGKGVLTAADQAAARAAIGAGTSNLVIGTTAETAAKGNHVHLPANQNVTGFLLAQDWVRFDKQAAKLEAIPVQAPIPQDSDLNFVITVLNQLLVHLRDGSDGTT